MIKNILVILTLLVISINSFAQDSNDKPKNSSNKMVNKIKTSLSKKKFLEIQEEDNQEEDKFDVVTLPDEPINNPAIRIRTNSREFYLKHRTALTVRTKKGGKFKSNIKEIYPNYMILSKNSTVVYYNEIKKIRIFPHRRFFARVLIPSLYPIFYAAQSKSLFMNTKKCKKKIQEIKVINKYRQFSFGKDDCNLN
jgi:hypothetical protein